LRAVTRPQLPHHHANGSVHGGSRRTRKPPVLREEAQETVSAQIASRDYPLIRWPHVLSAQHLLDKRRSLGFGFFSTCRECLTRGGRTLSGSAAYFPTPLRHLSLLDCVCLTHRTFRANSAPPVRPFTACAQRLLRPRLTSAHPSPRLSASLASSADEQTSQGKARDFPPIHPSHLRPFGPDGIGLRVFLPPHPPPGRLYALRVPRAGSLLTASFPPHLAVTRLLFG